MTTTVSLSKFQETILVFNAAPLKDGTFSVSVDQYPTIIGKGSTLHDALNDLHRNKETLFIKEYSEE